MTSQWDNNYDDDDENQDDNKKSKGNSLRDKLEAALAENKTLRERVDKAEASARQATVSALVKEKGLDPKVVKLMPKDIEPNEEAVTAWLDEYGDVFATPKPKETEGAGSSTESDSTDEGADDDAGMDEYQKAMQVMQRAQSGVQNPGKQTDMLRKLNDPNITREQLLELIAAQGGGYGTG